MLFRHYVSVAHDPVKLSVRRKKRHLGVQRYLGFLRPSCCVCLPCIVKLSFMLWVKVQLFRVQIVEALRLAETCTCSCCISPVDHCAAGTVILALSGFA